MAHDDRQLREAPVVATICSRLRALRAVVVEKKETTKRTRWKVVARRSWYWRSCFVSWSSSSSWLTTRMTTTTLPLSLLSLHSPGHPMVASGGANPDQVSSMCNPVEGDSLYCFGPTSPPTVTRTTTSFSDQRAHCQTRHYPFASQVHDVLLSSRLGYDRRVGFGTAGRRKAWPL